jgi:hypothetical protein
MFVLEARANAAHNGIWPESGMLPTPAQLSASLVFHRISPFRHVAVPMIEDRDSNWLQRTVATAGYHD